MEDNTKYMINSATRKILNSSLLTIVTAMAEKLLYPVLISLYVGSQGFVMFYVVSFMPLVANIIGESLGMSASILYSKSLGERNINEGRSKVYQLNTLVVISSLLLVLVCVCLTYILTAEVLGMEEGLFQLSMLYMRLLSIMLFIMIIFDYFVYLLRCTSNPDMASILTSVKHVISCSLLAILLIVCDYGVISSPISTTVAYFIVVLVPIYHFLKKDSQINIRFEIPKIETIKEIWQYSGKVIVERVTQAALDAFINISILVVFTIDIVNVVYLQKSVAIIFFTLPKAITFAMVPILSVYYNKRNNKANAYITKKFLRISLICGLIVSSIVLIFRYPIVEDLFNFEYPDILNIAIFAICILALYFPIRFVNHIISNILMCLKLNRISVPIVSMELFVLPVLFITIAVMSKNEALLWWVLPLSEAITLLMFFVVSFFYRKKHNTKSWFFMEKFDTKYKNSFYILIDIKHMEDVELYQEMAVMFLKNNGIQHENTTRVYQIIGELVEYAIDSHHKKRSLVDIQMHIDMKDNIIINANIDNDNISYRFDDKDFIYEIPNEDLYINMYMLKKLSTVIECSRVLSFTSLMIEIETKNKGV